MWLSGVRHPRRTAPVLVGVIAKCVFLAAWTLTAVGCIPRVTPNATPAGTAPRAEQTAFTVTALPVYRLVTSPVVADEPSRLMVIQVRLASVDEALLQFTPQDLTLTLPDGTYGRVFDRARSLELLRRTTLAEADMAYLQQPDHVPGGISQAVVPQLAEAVRSNLLGDGVFGGSQALEGFLVVDTGQPLPTFDGAAIEVVAHRVSDATPARYAYQFARTPPATEAQ
jgi:hypothetical protein